MNIEPPEGLLNKIITAIKREREIRQARRSAFVFFGLFFASVASAPFSALFLISQWSSSGISHFISAFFSIAGSDFGLALVMWQDFLFSILESMPVAGIVLFSTNLVILLIAARIFFYKKLSWKTKIWSQPAF